MWTVYEMACFLFHVQWTSSCDHAATNSTVLYRISYDVGVVPQLQFIDRVFSLVVNIDSTHNCGFSAWVWVVEAH